MRRVFTLAFAAVVGAPAGLPAAASVGSPAPPLEPQEWLNTKEKLTWASLKGRVILVEKWATT